MSVNIYCLGPGPHGPAQYVPADGYLGVVDVEPVEGFRCPNCTGAAQTKKKELLAQARTAYTNNLDFLALTAPTTSESIAQVRRLTQQMQGVLRVISNMLD